MKCVISLAILPSASFSSADRSMLSNKPPDVKALLAVAQRRFTDEGGGTEEY